MIFLIIKKAHPNKTSIWEVCFFINLFIYFIIFLNKELNDFSFLFLSDLNLLYFFNYSEFFIFGYLDDRFNFNANLKLVILITLVFLVLRYDNNLLISYLNLSFSEKIIFLDNFSLVFTIFCFIAFINAFNLFDGINCQIGLYLFFVVTIIFVSGSNLLLFGSLLFSLIVFLILNSKGRIFMGNSGSYLLGFLLSYIIIKIYNNSSSLYSDKILLIMFLPGIDMIRLFFIRIKNKKNPFSPDRNHLHHKLLEKFGYKYTIFITCSFMVLPYFASLYFKSYISLIIFTFIYFLLNRFLNSAKNF